MPVRNVDSRQRLWQRSGAAVRLNRIRSRDPGGLVRTHATDRVVRRSESRMGRGNEGVNPGHAEPHARACRL